MTVFTSSVIGLVSVTALDWLPHGVSCFQTLQVIGTQKTDSTVSEQFHISSVLVVLSSLFLYLLKKKYFLNFTTFWWLRIFEITLISFINSFLDGRLKFEIRITKNLNWKCLKCLKFWYFIGSINTCFSLISRELFHHLQNDTHYESKHQIVKLNLSI